MNVVKIILCALFVQLIIVQPLCSATIKGRVLCEDGTPYPDPVSINVIGQNKDVTSDEYGQYSLNLHAGTYIFKMKNKYFKVFVYPYDTPRDFYLPCKEKENGK